MKNLICAAVTVITLPAYAVTSKDTDTLYQVSTINALLHGLYDGEVAISELKKHGDFGIGTFDALDGEMLVLDGTVYRVGSDGSINVVKGTAKTPFAAVTFFEADKPVDMTDIPSLEKMYQLLDNSISGKNIFQAIRIKGLFTYVKTRAPLKQSKPYPKLVDALKGQPVFEFSNVKGTLTGFRSPNYVNGINVPGYHFHFITEDKKSGGHLLDCNIKTAKAEIDDTSAFTMVLPKSQEFNNIDLASDRREELNKAEKK